LPCQLQHADVRDARCIGNKAKADPELDRITDGADPLVLSFRALRRRSLDAPESEAVTCSQKIVASRAVSIVDAWDHVFPLLAHAVRIVTRKEDVEVQVERGRGSDQ